MSLKYEPSSEPKGLYQRTSPHLNPQSLNRRYTLLQRETASDREAERYPHTPHPQAGAVQRDDHGTRDLALGRRGNNLQGVERFYLKAKAFTVLCVPYSLDSGPQSPDPEAGAVEREFFIDNLLVRIHCIIVMIRWTGLAPWGFEFPFPGSLTSAFLSRGCTEGRARPWRAQSSSREPSSRPTTRYEYVTYKTVKARFWPWLAGKSPYNVLSCSLFARQRRGTSVWGQVPCRHSRSDFSQSPPLVVL